MAAQTVTDKLLQLYELQEIDSKIKNIEVLKGELPMEVSALEDETIGLQTRSDRFKESVENLEKEIGRHNANIKEAEALILRYQSQMDNVKNNREYDALTKELELQKLEIQLSQKKIGKLEVEMKNKTEMFDNTQERIDNKKSELETKKVELEKIIEKTDKEEKKLKNKSDKVRKQIEDRMLKAYDKIKTSYRNGMAVVEIKRDSCGGCFNKIPPQSKLEINQGKKFIYCEHCGRILVGNYVNPQEEAAK